MRQGSRDDLDVNALIHQLNQRYRVEFDRAEQMQAELRTIQGSRLWPWFVRIRNLARWFRRSSSTPAPHSPITSGDPGSHSWSKVFQPQVTRQLTPHDVSIIIPFRDQVDLLESCVVPLYRTVPDVELVLVDNGSTEPRTRNFLHKCRVQHKATIVHLDEPFNFSRLCNAGAAVVHRDTLLFLNNDVQAIHPGWLEAMLELAGDPRVGIIGATLLYPDRTLQHVGLAPIGPSETWIHPYRGEPETYPGPRQELRQVRTVPAVTGACLMIQRDLFEKAGGFDPRHAVVFNDVDLCQRVIAQGWEVVITPFARLLHFESLSRGYQQEVA